jgi:hypothetical protein
MSECKDLIVWTPTAKHHVELVPGTSIQEAYSALPAEMHSPAMEAFRGGVLIPREDWAAIRLYPGDHISFALVPQGGGGKGKGIIGAIVGVVAIVVGSVTGNAFLVQIGVGLLLSSVASLLIKPPSLNSNMSDSTRDSSYYGITGQSNEAKPYQPVPKLYGRHKMYPLIATAPVIRNAGEQSRIAALYDFGVGMYNINNLRIGETPVEVFSPALVFHWNEQTPAMQLVTGRVNSDQLQFVLQQGQPLFLQSDDNASWIEIDLAFARGFAYYNDSGNATNTSVNFRAYYREISSGNWIGIGPDKVIGIAASYLPGESNANGPVDFIDPQGYVSLVGRDRDQEIYIWYGVRYDRPRAPDGTNGYTNITFERVGSYNAQRGGYELRLRAIKINAAVSGFTLTAASQKPIVAAINLGPLGGSRYEIQITRLDPISTSSRRIDEATVTQNKTFLYGNVVNLRVPHTMLEMSLIGSDKLSGVVQTLNADAVSVLYQYDQWGNIIAFSETRNPAWICLDILLGPCNPRPLSPAQIDFYSWWQLAVYCDQLRTWTVNGQQITDIRFPCDIVVDYQSTVQELIDSILATCHATRNITYDGRWGVTIDEKGNFTPRQLITPSNSWNFSGRRTFSEEVHAFKVSFIDASSEYTKQEIIVYRDGYSAANATKFESIGTIGVTTFYHAWAYGRYMFAQAISRQEIFTLSMDVEHLAVQRGDGVQVQHDVPKIGGYPSRVVKALPGNQVVIAAQLASQPAAYTVRRRDGSVVTGRVVSMAADDTLVLDNAVNVQFDDLIVVGALDSVTEQFIVLGITPGEDLSAVLTLVRYDADMYDSDLGPLPAWDPTWGTDVINVVTLAVISATEQSSLSYVLRRPVQTWLISFTVNQPGVYGYVEAYLVVPGFPDEYIGRTSGLNLTYTAELLNSKLSSARTASVRLEPYTSGGLQGISRSVTLTLKRDSVPPDPVKNFAVNVQAETIAMFWDLQDNPDTWQHEIRYHPDPVNGSWELAQQLGLYDWWVTTANCGARTGRYFIRTYDTTGNASVVQWQRTTIEQLPDIDLVETVLETGWPGRLASMFLNAADKPQLLGDFGSVAQEGFYYFNQTVDLAEIYEVRVSSKILGHALSSYSYMASWVPIANQRPLAPGYAGYWSIGLEYRASNVIAVMADWLPLSSPQADPIGGSRIDAWTPWRGIQVGDVTARFLQFRIRANTKDPNISVVLDSARTDIDVRERRWFLNDQAVPAGGKRFSFDPAFQRPPTIAITTNGGTATRYTITDKDRLGFYVELFDGATSVAGNIDIAVIGWGKEKTVII